MTDEILKHLEDPEIRAVVVAHYAMESAKFEAEARAADAKAEQSKAEALKFTAEAREAAAEAEQSEINSRKAKRDEDEALAGDKYHHTYAFTSEVSEASVKACIERLSYWSRTSPGCAITIIFDSPGGGVISGLALFDFIMSLRRAGHSITTLALGYAASMAGILLQAGETRVMGKEAWLLIHEIQFSAIGKIGEVEDTTEWVKKIQKRVLAIFAERSTLTVRQLEKRWKRKDWWIDSDEALKLGLVDEVR